MALNPKKINSFLFVDSETSGLDKENGLHSQKYAMTEFAVLAVDGVKLEKILAYDNLIKPYDDNLIYDPEAASHSGISRAMCEKDGIELSQLVDDLIVVFKEANLHNTRTAKPIFVAHNWPYDRGFVQDIFRRTGKDLGKYVSGDLDCYGNFIPAGIDTIDMAKMCWGHITDTTTKFRLENCCELAGVECIDAHHAMNDVIPMTDLFRFFVDRLRSGGSGVTLGEQQQPTHRLTFEW